jgi:SAM-dependent methyltransferase
MSNLNIKDPLIQIELPININKENFTIICCPICNKTQKKHFSKIIINRVDIFIDYCSEDDVWWIGTRPGMDFYNNLYENIFYKSPIPEQFGYASLESGKTHRREKAILNWNDIEKGVCKPIAGSFLEIGCSTGEMLQEAVTRGWKKVTGIDIDVDSCKIALNKGLNVFHGSFESVDMLDEKFDLIFSDNVIEHLFDPIFALKRCFLMQNKGACLILRLPETFKTGPNLKLIDHTYHYTKKSITLLLSAGGYKVDRLFFSGSYFSKDKTKRIDNMTVIAYRL